jgi:predicted ribosome quality control (RQC) complex YloA/Tae2 family protein
MGFWSRLLGKKDAKLNIAAVDGDGDGLVQDGTIWERPASMAVDLDKTLEKAEKLLKEFGIDADLDEAKKKAARQAAAKKSAATRAANKAKAIAESSKVAEVKEAAKKTPSQPVKKTQPKKK